MVFWHHDVLLVIRLNVREKLLLQAKIFSFCTESCLGFSPRAWVPCLIKIEQKSPTLPSYTIHWEVDGVRQPSRSSGVGLAASCLGFNLFVQRKFSVWMQAHLASNLFNFFEHRTFHTRHGNWQFGKVRGVGLQGASMFHTAFWLWDSQHCVPSSNSAVFASPNMSSQLSFLFYSVMLQR